MFSPASDSTPVVNAQTPTSSDERKCPSVDCAPSMAPSSLERPSPIASSIEPEMSITSSTDDGLRICVHWSIAAETTSTAGLGSVTAGPAGSTPYSAVNSSPSGAAASSGRKPYSGRIFCAASVCRNAAKAAPAVACTSRHPVGAEHGDGVVRPHRAARRVDRDELLFRRRQRLARLHGVRVGVALVVVEQRRLFERHSRDVARAAGAVLGLVVEPRQHLAGGVAVVDHALLEHPRELGRGGHVVGGQIGGLAGCLVRLHQDRREPRRRGVRVGLRDLERAPQRLADARPALADPEQSASKSAMPISVPGQPSALAIVSGTPKTTACG